MRANRNAPPFPCSTNTVNGSGASLDISTSRTGVAASPPHRQAIAKANQRHSYDELLYVRKHYFSVEALRQANAAIVNKILALRNPHLWGESHTCASDGKLFESWSQNLITEWRSRCHGYGVLVYLSEASDK
jgi:hypothetical protein